MVTQRDAREFIIPEFTLPREGRLHRFRENLAILLAPVRGAAPTQGGQRFQVRSLWLRPEKLGRAQWVSLATHSLFIALLALSVTQTVKKNGGTTIPIGWARPVYPGPPPRILAAAGKAGNEGGSGSGGERNPIEATAGKLARIARTQLTPPSPRRNPDAILQVEATVIGPPNVPIPKSAYPNYGLPEATRLTNSAGPGGGDGFGNNPDGLGGVGNGLHRGYGDEENGVGIGPRIPGNGGVSYPQCVYCPTPLYTDEARKAKLQGQVELNVLVTADGRVARIEIVRGMGLGLDERTREMVRSWRFKPARDAAGRAVSVWTPIEVTFRLL